MDGSCTCNNITYREIIHLVDKHDDIKSIEDLQQYCHCADRCSRCYSDIKEIIDLLRTEK